MSRDNAAASIRHALPSTAPIMAPAGCASAESACVFDCGGPSRRGSRQLAGPLRNSKPGVTRYRQGHGTVWVRLLVSRNPLTVFWIHCLSIIWRVRRHTVLNRHKCQASCTAPPIGPRIAPACVTVKTTLPGGAACGVAGMFAERTVWRKRQAPALSSADACLPTRDLRPADPLRLVRAMPVPAHSGARRGPPR